MVKGVTWDPVGKYLASQSDDKTLRVWRTSDWQQESSVSEPFADCSGTTHVLRISWSPDGHYVVSAHAMNNGGPVAKILERDGWKMKMDFVGHRKAVTCVVRFLSFFFFDVILFSKNNKRKSVIIRSLQTFVGCTCTFVRVFAKLSRCHNSKDMDSSATFSWQTTQSRYPAVCISNFFN